MVEGGWALDAFPNVQGEKGEFMRKVFALFAILALAVPTTALAVDLHQPHVGTTCADGGVFHFVANGVDGKVGTLTATFSDGGSVTDLPAQKSNKGTNHWTIEAIGTLQSASATEGAKLVLSDYTCSEKDDEKK